MRTSEQINEIVEAVAAAQAELQDAVKTKKGYGYMYADLADTLKIARAAYGHRGVAIFQDCYAEGDMVGCSTILAHKSGQWIENGSVRMVVEAKKGLSMAQCIGSTMTYARRYSLQAACGFASDDDDTGVPAVEAASAITQEQAQEILAGIEDSHSDKARLLKTFHVQDVSQMTVPQYQQAMAIIKRKLEAAHAKD